MLHVKEVSRPESNDVIAIIDHRFGDATIWNDGVAGRPYSQWKVTCTSGTRTFGGGCYSSSKLYVEYGYGGDEKTFLFGGDFRDGQSEKRDRPDLHIYGFKILEDKERSLVIEIITGMNSRFFKLRIHRSINCFDEWTARERW